MPADSLGSPAQADQDPDLLAAAVLHALLRAAREPLTLEQTAAACQRNPQSQGDLDTIQAALTCLVDDGLAYKRGSTFGPTRAALRAEQLSF